MKKTLFTLFGLASLNAFAGPIIIPMPIHSSGGGGGDPKGLLALTLAVNTICITIFMILCAIWVIKKSKNPNFDKSFFEYCINLNWYNDLNIGGVNSMLWIIMNFLGLLFILARFFAKNL